MAIKIFPFVTLEIYINHNSPRCSLSFLNFTEPIQFQLIGLIGIGRTQFFYFSMNTVKRMSEEFVQIEDHEKTSLFFFFFLFDISSASLFNPVKILRKQRINLNS